MDVIRAILREHPDPWRRALLVAGGAGIANAAILGLINRGAAIASTDNGDVGLRLVVLFAICMIAFYYGKRYALIQASVVVEHMVRNRLLRVADCMRRTELEIVEHLGRGEPVFEAGQGHRPHLAVRPDPRQRRAAVLRPRLLPVLHRLAVEGGLRRDARDDRRRRAGLHAPRAAPRKLLQRLTVKEAELIDVVSHMVDGFKEIRLDRKKNDAIYERLVGVSGATRDLKIDAQTGFCVDIMFSDLFFYSLLAVVVFLLPRFMPTYGAVVLHDDGRDPVHHRPAADGGAGRARLRAREDRAGEPDRPRTAAGRHARTGRRRRPRMPTFEGFKSFSLDGACFTYGLSHVRGVQPNGHGGAGGASGDGGGNGGGFSVGPLNLTITRGETIFLVGGNGSGKTTMLKVLTGLLPAAARRAESRPHADRPPQRPGLSRAVLDRLHAVPSLRSSLRPRARGRGEGDVGARRPAARRQDAARERPLHHLDLSTGQQQRLALAICLLEDKDILVFDEWAADQDPHFRKHFYEHVLSRLKAQGKTIIAATHDDRFWGIADRVIRLEYGVAVDESGRHSARPPRTRRRPARPTTPRPPPPPSAPGRAAGCPRGSVARSRAPASSSARCCSWSSS